MQNTKETRQIGESINEFIQKHRKPIFICVGVLVLALIVFFTALAFRNMFTRKAINAVEELGTRYEELLPSIWEEYMAGDINELLNDLESFARKNSGYAASKAWSIMGNIHSELEEWEEAEAVWVSAAKAGVKIYLAGIAWFNAAAAAEEQGKTETAIEYYIRSISAPAGFAGASRAQFSVGRLWESLDETDAAIEAYRAVISEWPHETTWVNMAHSRIISLESK